MTMSATIRRILPPMLLRCAAVALLAGFASAAAAAPAKKDDGFQTAAPTAMLIDAESGSVLFEKNADELVPPASLSKLMTAEVVFNEIKSGRLKATDEFIISTNAWRRGGAPSRTSSMFAPIHSRVTVDDLLHSVVIQSGNDACIALAEGIAGSEEKFAVMMTERARALGLSKATFGNATGLPDPRQLMTVRELAKLAQHIIQNHPEFYQLYGQREFTYNRIRQYNRNPLLAMNIGADGLKTGYTKEAGYGLVGSAVRDGLRLIVVVNGLRSEKERADEARKTSGVGLQQLPVRPSVRRWTDNCGSAGLWRRTDPRAARRQSRRAPDGAAWGARADPCTRGLFGAGAGAGAKRPAHRLAQSMARRLHGARSTAPGGRGCRIRHAAAAGL